MASDREERNTVLGMPRDADPYARQGEEPQHVLGFPVQLVRPRRSGSAPVHSGIPSRRTSAGRYAAAWVLTHLKKVTRSRRADPIPEGTRAAGRTNRGIPPCLSSSRGRARRVGRGGSASHQLVPPGDDPDRLARCLAPGPSWTSRRSLTTRSSASSPSSATYKSGHLASRPPGHDGRQQPAAS